MGGVDLVPREQPYQTAIHCQRSQLRHRFSVAPPLTRARRNFSACTHARMRSGRGKGEEKYVWALSTGFRASEVCAECASAYAAECVSWAISSYAARAQLRSAIKISYKARVSRYGAMSWKGLTTTTILFRWLPYNSSKRRGRRQ